VEDILVPAMAFASIFIALPWLIFHYITKWKTAKTLTGDDEKLLDDLYEAARRLDDRLGTIERIMTAENPDWQRSSLTHQRSSDSRLLDQIDALEDEARVPSRRKVK
jgi:phage shock protein B